jgi:Ca2+-transporting ATPase
VYGIGIWAKHCYAISIELRVTDDSDGLTVPGFSNAWSLEVSSVLDTFSVDPSVGLSTAECVSRRNTYGSNQLSAAKRRGLLYIVADQFKSLVVLLLCAAALLAMAFSETVEGIAIFVVIAINASIGFVTELRAIRSMEALSRLGQVETMVMRDGVLKRIPAEDLVPGDIVHREAGDIVTADSRLIEAADLRVDESTLTGESMPVQKITDTIAANTPIMERSNMLFKGTAITRGTARAVVVNTGLCTELGRISALVDAAEAHSTPLEKRLNLLAQRLVVAVVILAVFVAIAGILSGRDTFLAIEVAIALAVAAIPEGLPIVATIALARGMWRMARKNALIARLSAVETLGATSVILTDKTGTLTENSMSVTSVKTADTDIEIAGASAGKPDDIKADGHDLEAASAALLDELLLIASLCNNASIDSDDEDESQAVGDPTEIALLRMSEARNISRRAMLKRHPKLRELAFDPSTRMMATLHGDDSSVLVAVKGAPEAILPICTSVQTVAGPVPISASDRDEWSARASQLGDRGLRTLAIARKKQSSIDDEVFAELELVGIVGLEDPARAGVKDAIRRCHNAGITVIMVTGDHAATARNIATAVDIVTPEADSGEFLEGTSLEAAFDNEHPERLDQTRVFSRVSPEQKLRLIDGYQQHAQVVAMTGDGVNDAPALKKADIGVAMGIRGTPVAKEAAEMVLLDDEFGTIVEAVAQGRAIYENIRKFIIYLLSCNISEVLIVVLATVAGVPLPLLPLQILFLNLVTDVFPALALGVGEGSRDLMKRNPRPFAEPLLTRYHWTCVVLHGFVIAMSVLAAMAIAVTQLAASADEAVTVSFCTLTLAQVWHVFNMRDDMSNPFNNEITRNLWIWLAVAICLLLLLAAVYLPFLSNVLKLGSPSFEAWLLIVAMSTLPILAAPLVRWVAGLLGKPQV